MTVETASQTTEVRIDQSVRERCLDLFLISFVILFFELAFIRWFGSNVIFLTFFTNLVLMACFLGMSVGLLSAGRTQNLISWVFPLALSTTVLAVATVAISRRTNYLLIDVGGQNSPQQVFFGTSTFRAPDPSQFVVPIEMMAAVFFVMISLTFIGLGQVMGRAFDAIPNRVVAYSVDILGSLTGIVIFGLMSLFRTPPVLWYGIAAVLILHFLPRLNWFQVACAIALVAGIGWISYREGAWRVTMWSPYYKIQYNAQTGTLTTNNIGHQEMVSVGDSGAAYMLPHLLSRDAGNAPFGRQLIIGAGSGNDVSAALQSDVGHVDAVEIEPVLNEIGRRDHPKNPYSDPRVSIYLDDGRSFVRRSDQTYDMITYALVDSLVLHSGYSSLRLESFLFTEQAFSDISARLGDDGVFVMYNYFRQGWIVGRLVEMARKVFGTEPIVISLPYLPSIQAADVLKNDKFTFVIAGKPGSKCLESIRKKLKEDGFFWVSKRPLDNVPINGYRPTPPEVAGVPAESWLKIGPAAVDISGIGPLPTDDWPFLYLRAASIPGLNLRAMALIVVLSLVILLAFAPVRAIRPNARMFFLGAGFMLLETKGVVHMALLFGSTWAVNSIVFFAILVMILLSNIFVLAWKPRVLWPYYTWLIVALLVNAIFPMSYFLNLPGPAKIVASCAVVFIPIFFAGVIFATSFGESLHPDVDFGSNIAGVILGGLSENLSLMLGFNHLLLVAIAYYVLSALLRPRLGGPAAGAAS
jgi:Spermine/spermidine synthase domain